MTSIHDQVNYIAYSNYNTITEINSNLNLQLYCSHSAVVYLSNCIIIVNKLNNLMLLNLYCSKMSAVVNVSTLQVVLYLCLDDVAKYHTLSLCTNQRSNKVQSDPTSQTTT